MEQAKWTTIYHIKGQSSYKEGKIVYMAELEESPLLWALSLENQAISSNKYWSQSDQLKAALDEKHQN